MTNDPDATSGGPNQSQLDLLSQRLEEHFNACKDEPCAKAIKDWDEAYAPGEAFSRLRHIPDAFSLKSKPLWEKICTVILFPILIPLVAIVAVIDVFFGTLGYMFRLLRARFNPPRPKEADLAYRIRFLLSAETTRTYRDVIRIVRTQTKPFAIYLTDYFTPTGDLTGSQFGHARLEYGVLRACLQHCPGLVDAATAKVHEIYRQSLSDIHRARDNDPDSPDVIILGLCWKCGGSLILKDGGWLTCSRCRFTPHHPAKHRARFQSLLDERHDREAMQRTKSARSS
jgi:hypothetical protein